MVFFGSAILCLSKMQLRADQMLPRKLCLIFERCNLVDFISDRDGNTDKSRLQNAVQAELTMLARELWVLKEGMICT